MFDVEEILTHGGSLRIYAKHKDDDSQIISPNVLQLIDKEISKGINTLDYYAGFQERALEVKLELLDFLIQQKLNGKKVSAYGAAAKGNTLLNFCGIKSDLIDFVVDANPHKQSKFLPGSHIPVVNENYLIERRPDYILIFPWNLTEEIIHQLSYVKEWGGQFVVPIPKVKIL